MNICILIVDDDRLVVEKLKKGIDWQRLEIGTVLTASNIRQAKTILEEVPVDILLTDIEMPQGSGLELLEWARDKGLSLECVFLSSYAYFAYAQKAIYLGSSNYLLKPVSNREMEEALAGLVKGIQKEKARKDEKGERADAFWEKYIQQEKVNPSLLESAEQMGIFKPEKRILLLILRLFPASSQKKRKDVVLDQFIVQNVTEEYFHHNESETELLSLVRRSDYQWFLVLGEEEKEESLKKILNCYLNCMEKVLSMKGCIYLGNGCEESKLPESRKILEYMEQEAVPGETGILCVGEWMKRDVEYISPPWKEWEKEMLDPERICETGQKVEKFIHRLWEQNQVTVSVLEKFRRELMQAIYRYFNKQDELITRIFDGKEFDNYYEQSVKTLPDMEGFIRYIFSKLSGFRRQDNRQEVVVEQMKHYIDEHLKEELSRKTLAGIVYLSEDYVSKLFINVTGMSIPSYVASRRVEKAQEYLKYSCETVSKIALEVGYSNFSYFSKTFRDYTGCTPNEYRSRIRKNEYFVKKPDMGD